MDISSRKRIITFFVWLMVVPSSFYFAVTYFPSGSFDWLNIASLLGIMYVTALVALRIGNTTVSLERWVAFVVFLQYGFFMQLVFTQLTLLLLLCRPRSGVPKLHRLLIHSAVHAVVGSVSAFVFHFAGGSLGAQDFVHVLAFASLYAIAFTTAHQLLAKLLLCLGVRLLTGNKEGIVWDYVITFLMLSFSLSLYFLYALIGNESILLVGIPFVIALVVMNMYSRAHTLNEKLEAATKMGRELANELRHAEMIKLFLGKMKEIIPFDNAYLYEATGKQEWKLLGACEKGIPIREAERLESYSAIGLDRILDTDAAKIYTTPKDKQTLAALPFLHPADNVMISPIKRHRKLEGFVVLTARRPRIFQKVESRILLIVASYFAMSLEKARYYEKQVASSETCGLTNLYNYETLLLKLEKMFKAIEREDIGDLSVIMLDIDHFKKINDTYGHESGNELLVQLAALLRHYAASSDIVARYGGEEFVLLMPGVSRNEAAGRAEQLRQLVESHRFSIKADLSTSRKTIDVHMTISLGVATGPEDAKNAQNLLRNADRALYIGGKRAGRNRVGVHEV